MSVNIPPSSSYNVPIFAILVGIDTYSAPFSPLNKAAGDVNKLKKLLMDHPQIKLEDKYIKILINEDATRENILEALSSLPKGLPRNNSVLFYFSGYSGSANDSGVLCPVDTFKPGVGAISDKTLVRLFESMSLFLNGNITVFLDCFSDDFKWENPTSFVVISPEKATETEDGGAFTKSLIEVLKGEEHLDGLTNQTLVDKIKAAMAATVYCHGQQANHVIFNPRSKPYHLFLRGRTEPGNIVIDAGYAQGIRTGTFFGVYASNVQRDWNTVLGHLVVESIQDTQTNVIFQEDKSFDLPLVFFAVELDSELDMINAYIPGGTSENELKSIQYIPGLKIVDSPKDAEIALKFWRVKEQDVFYATWFGIESDKERQRITTNLSSPDYSPIWLPLEILRNHVRNFARFKYHIGRSIPDPGYATLKLEWKLVERGETNKIEEHKLEGDSIHIQLKKDERRGPFYVTLRNPNKFPVWPHIFICIGDDHVINDWYESKLDSPLHPQKMITAPQDEEDGLYFSWNPSRPTDLFYIKIFATRQYSSFSSMKQKFWPGDEVKLRELDNTKSDAFEAPEVEIPDRVMFSSDNDMHSYQKSYLMRRSAPAKKFHWAEARLTIKVDFASQEDKTTKTESDGSDSEAQGQHTLAKLDSEEA